MSIPESAQRITNEVSAQAEIIEQIKAALEGKAAGSGGIQLPTLENPGSAEDLAAGKQLIGADGSVVTGRLPVSDSYFYGEYTQMYDEDGIISPNYFLDRDMILRKNTRIFVDVPAEDYGNAGPADVRSGKTFTSKDGFCVKGEALLPGGGFVYPDGAFAPVKSFTAGKQYALVAMIGGVRRYINTTTYNNYTMNATQIAIEEDAGDYVIFSETPALFTAVASGDGFLLQNGTNYLHGTSSGGTALRVGTTQMVWTVDTSETGGFSEGKYNAKEDANAVWLMNASGGYNWSIKYETAGSFGYDREGRDNTYSTGFVPFVLYEYVAGEGEISPIVDTSDANVTADKMLDGYSGYANGRKVNGSIQLQSKTVTANGTVAPDAGKLLSSVTVNVPASGITPSGTRSITENGTYDVTEYASAVVNVQSSGGGSGRLVCKSGTVTNASVIETGLSEIEEFFIHKTSHAAAGLIMLHYSKENGTSRLYSTTWSSYSKNVNSGTDGASISGGTVTIDATTAATGGLSSNAAYTWVAVGTE